MTTFERDLTIGSMGRDVLQLQQVLESLKFGDFIPSGVFGPKTKSAVALYQIARGISPSVGYFGPITRAKMNLEFNLGDREILYSTALSCLGKDASPNDVVPDEVGCAESVSDILIQAFPKLDIPLIVSTNHLYNYLESSRSFIRIDQPLRGDIIISPTGYSSKYPAPLPNGHVGIFSDNNQIMSNNSDTGLFDIHYTLDSWNARYRDIGGYPVIYYRIV